MGQGAMGHCGPKEREAGKEQGDAGDLFFSLLVPTDLCHRESEERKVTRAPR